MSPRIAVSSPSTAPPRQGELQICYHPALHSRQHLGGRRERILERHRRLCRAYGSAHRLHVHHRKTGVNDRDLLVTLRIEQHPGAPVQLQLSMAA
jgi:hypothetical protein